MLVVLVGLAGLTAGLGGATSDTSGSCTCCCSVLVCGSSVLSSGSPCSGVSVILFCLLISFCMSSLSAGGWAGGVGLGGCALRSFGFSISAGGTSETG